MRPAPFPAKPGGMTVSGVLTTCASLLLAVGAYYADACNVPRLAPWLDYLSDRILCLVPLSIVLPLPLPPQTPFLVSAVAVGAVFFLVATLVTALLFPQSSEKARIENQVRDTVENKKRYGGGRNV